MRHRRHTNHLSRNAPHARAMLRNLAASVLQHQQITTTLAHAKAAQPFVDRLITLSKTGDLTARRRAIALLGSAPVTRRLFQEIGPRFVSRTGGYTRIIRLGVRRGDGAALALLELTERLVIAPPAPATKKRGKKAPTPETTADTGTSKPAPPKSTAAPRAESGAPPPSAKPRKLLDGLRQWWGRRQADRGGSSRG